MVTVEQLKRELDVLPAPVLNEVGRFIIRLKKKRSTATPGLLADLSGCLVDDDLPADLAEQHDHYLYGTPKK